MSETTIPDDPFDCEEFYDLMQAYRMSPMCDQSSVLSRYERVQTYCRNVVASTSNNTRYPNAPSAQDSARQPH